MGCGRCHYLTRLPPFTSSHCDPLGLTNGRARNLFAGDLLSHAQRQLRDLPNDRKTRTFTRCDCLSVCLCLISLPLLVGGSAARRQIDSAGCKQRGLIGVVIICLFNPPSNKKRSLERRAFSAASKRKKKGISKSNPKTKGRKGEKRREQLHHSWDSLLYPVPSLWACWWHMLFVHKNTQNALLGDDGLDAPDGRGEESPETNVALPSSIL